MNKELNEIFEIKEEKSQEIIKKNNNKRRHFLIRFLTFATIVIITLILVESNIMRVQNGYGILLISAFSQFFWFLFIIIELIKFQVEKKYQLRSINFKLLIAAMLLYLVIIEIGLQVSN